MNLLHTAAGIVLARGDQLRLLTPRNWTAYINRDDLYAAAEADFNSEQAQIVLPDWFVNQTFLPIVEQQEVWAAGVTYLRSRNARMDESKAAGGEPGGASAFYDNVYEAQRPELFLKATARRTVGTNQPVRIRRDSTWNVPEPELTLFVTTSGKIVGYTAGNDMSSRSIEGENPLYLPQAKTYDGCAALGPSLHVSKQPISPETEISLRIERCGETMFAQQIQINQMKRGHSELVTYLFCECTFPDGVFLMTGTGIVPPDTFTLQSGDVISITIDEIGTLQNWVE